MRLHINKENLYAEATAIAHTLLTDNRPGDEFFDQAEENLLTALVIYTAVSDNFRGEDSERTLETVKCLADRLANEGTLPELDELPEEDPAMSAWKMFKSSFSTKDIAVGLNLRLNPSK